MKIHTCTSINGSYSTGNDANRLCGSYIVDQKDLDLAALKRLPLHYFKYDVGNWAPYDHGYRDLVSGSESSEQLIDNIGDKQLVALIHGMAIFHGSQMLRRAHFPDADERGFAFTGRIEKYSFDLHVPDKLGDAEIFYGLILTPWNIQPW